MPDTCATCAFFMPAPGGQYGWCRERPPVPILCGMIDGPDGRKVPRTS
jgi:hypothetical protein